MRVRLKGITGKTVRLADGRVQSYWYAWKGGPRLKGEPGTPEFIASYNKAVARKVTPAVGILSSVLQKFRDSQAFKALAARTKSDAIASGTVPRSPRFSCAATNRG